MSPPRDPQRRSTILAAARQVIAEHGTGRVTHRRVAAKANVPLGSTTYYFKDLDQLVTAALDDALSHYTDTIRHWREELLTSDDLPSTLTRLTVEYLSDRATAITEFELCVAAAREPELRPLAKAWNSELYQALTQHASPTTSRAAIDLINGAMLAALWEDDGELDQRYLTDALTAVGL